MSNLEKLNNIFVEVFGIDKSVLNENFVKNSIDNWDSVHQLSLVTGIEDEFDLMLDTEDILDLTSYEKAIEILKKNTLL